MGTVKGPGGRGLGRSETQKDIHRPPQVHRRKGKQNPSWHS
ncbi:MAG: hypothetical protein XD50_1609 [Clostridia bacterium 41_269]|nr:MAG: hypothetical protein XD50_1609 [Clostridia bacterium 41_269]